MSPDMDIGRLKKFKRNWIRIGIFEDEQLRKMSLKERLHQLVSIVNIGIGMGLDFGEDQQKLRVRSRWIALKKGRGI